MFPFLPVWIVILVVAGGVVLLAPLARALGRALERRLESGSGPGGGGDGPDIIPILRRIEERMDAIEGEQERLREHQDFMDALLEQRDPPRIADGGGSDERDAEEEI
jgi:hypothetical protein